ncbi:MAG: hypothetical protein K2K90_17165 [Lachnospiraceae bacterium]|nr:hypothetical protein [Lachnospiraceae bacterium]
MIHNITEERKKSNRRDVTVPAPLTEEELMRLIGTVEERELLHAPGHLKGNILSQIQAGKRRERERALFSYRAKVLVGMAAALTVLFIVPVDGTDKGDMPRTGILESLYDGETQYVDEWERDILERQQDIEETWERYQAGQKRADARKRYFRKISEKFINHKNWED